MRRPCSRATTQAVGLLVAALTLLPGASSAAQGTLWAKARQPYEPRLLVNNDDAVCRGFQDSARRAFLSPAQTLDLNQFLPNDAAPVAWQPLTLPFVPRDGDQLSVASIDFKHDGHPLVVVRRANAWSWRGPTWSAFVFASRRALDEAIAGSAAIDTEAVNSSDDPKVQAMLAKGQQYYPPATEASSKHDAESWAWNELLAYHDGYYFLDQGNFFELQTASKVNVYHVTADTPQALACSIELMPGKPETALMDVPGLPSFLRVLRTIGTGGAACDGTLGSGRMHDQQAKGAAWRASARPWAVAPPPNDEGYYLYSPRVEAFLAQWGQADPWVRREYLTFTEHRLAAEQAMAGYVATHFGLNGTDAQDVGKAALDHLTAMHLLIPKGFSASEPGTEAEAGIVIDRPQALQQLLSGDGDHEHPNSFGKTLLMYAAHLNRLDAAQALLAAGANVNATTTSDTVSCPGTGGRRTGRTPLMYAAENASFALIAALVQAGAKADAVDSGGQGIADYLARNPRLRSAGLSPPVSLEQVLAELEKHPDTGAPSFPCAGTLTRIEQNICADPVAALFDRELSANYQLWKTAADDKATIQAEQQAWLKRRNESCASAADDADLRLCLEERLRARSRYIENRLEEIRSSAH